MEECNPSQTVQHLTFVCLVGQSILWIVSRTGFTGQSLSPLLICPRYVSPRKKILKKGLKLPQSRARMKRRWTPQMLNAEWQCCQRMDAEQQHLLPHSQPNHCWANCCGFQSKWKHFQFDPTIYGKKRPVAKGQIIDGHSFFFSSLFCLHTLCFLCHMVIKPCISFYIYPYLSVKVSEMCNLASVGVTAQWLWSATCQKLF